MFAVRLTRLVVTPAVAAACALLMFAPVSPSAAAPTVAAAKKCDATKETKTTKDDCPKDETTPTADPAVTDAQKAKDKAKADAAKAKAKDKAKGKGKKKKTKEEIEKEKKDAAEKAAAAAAATEALHLAEADLPRVTKRFKAATKRSKEANARLDGLNGKIQEARMTVARVARQAYITGVDPAALAQVVTLEAADATSWSNAQRMLKMVGDTESVRMAQAIALIESAEKEKKDADTEYAGAKAEYDLVTLNVRAARFSLGLSNDGPVAADVTEFFKTYPVPDCQFKPEDSNKTTRSCSDAMRYVLSQVTSPEKSWFNLCLNLVTIAYGAPQTIPNAIDQWNSMPEDLRHSPNTVAPPGALMFWAPNHVAISLGNNMIASNDVLGTGRVWIVSFQTIQARWNLAYLGWTAPDFRNA
ncbi:MAG: hypothetical protein V9E85_13925 [Candidatus Nanopelagicales bacterium]